MDMYDVRTRRDAMNMIVLLMLLMMRESVCAASQSLSPKACYHNPARRCQSKTLSHPDFESTYTNKASFGAFAVC